MYSGRVHWQFAAQFMALLSMGCRGQIPSKYHSSEPIDVQDAGAAQVLCTVRTEERGRNRQVRLSPGSAAARVLPGWHVSESTASTAYCNKSALQNKVL